MYFTFKLLLIFWTPACTLFVSWTSWHKHLSKCTNLVCDPKNWFRNQIMIFFLFFFWDCSQFFNENAFLLNFCRVGFNKLIGWIFHNSSTGLRFIVEVKKVFDQILHLFLAFLSIFLASDKKFVYWLGFGCFLLLFMLCFGDLLFIFI